MTILRFFHSPKLSLRGLAPLPFGLHPRENRRLVEPETDVDRDRRENEREQKRNAPAPLFERRLGHPEAARADDHQRRKNPRVAVVWIQLVCNPRFSSGACSAT